MGLSMNGIMGTNLMDFPIPNPVLITDDLLIDFKVESYQS